MSRLSPAVLLSILIVSCLFIFLGPGNSSPLVGIILGFILAFGLVLTFSGGTVMQREASRRMMGTFTAVVAVASAALIGQDFLGNMIGLICAPVLMIAAYTAFLAILSRSGLNVEEGEVLLIQRRMDHQHVIRPPGLHSPMVPALEAGVAVMPTYNIETDVDVDMVDTSVLHKVDRITVDTKCRIIQHFPEGDEAIPVEMRYEGFLKLPYNYPNRDHVFRDLADKRNQPISEARMTADFWIEAIQLQISNDVDQELRAIIHDSTFYNPEKRTYGKLGPADISARRSEVSALLRQRVQEQVTQWGIEILELDITQVMLNPDRIKSFYQEFSNNREIRDAERKLRLEVTRTRELAEAEAFKMQRQAEAELEVQRKRNEVELEIQRRRNEMESDQTLAMLKHMVETLLAENPDLKPDDLKHMVMITLEEHKRMQYRDRAGLLPMQESQ
ncbi:MAG TPA: SPFH domain-containing protein [Herpetosiphonaceae bacterium]|nr:SPFH domain-containing protein [Herpetosiphonaceae bacterium]